LTPVHVEANYHLGYHILRKRNAQEFSPLQPVLQQRKEKDVIKSKVSVQVLFFQMQYGNIRVLIFSEKKLHTSMGCEGIHFPDQHLVP